MNIGDYIPLPLFSGIIGWITGQLIKTVINFVKTKKIDGERLYGAGGMPSAHSAGVAALCFSIGTKDGIFSSEFSIAFIFSLITLYDAMSVRWNAGLHARVLNRIIAAEENGAEDYNNLPKEKKHKKKKLKEYLGHSPLEVTCGIALGIVLGALINIPYYGVN